jgi:deoxyribonuclease V
MALYKKLHDWNLAPREAIALQNELRTQVQLEPLKTSVATVAGCDISFDRFSDVVYAGIVVIDLETMETLEETGVVAEAKFPYIPGLLSFRELPSVLQAWGKLRMAPDAVMFDGQGIAHPRRLGIAAHGGLFLDHPTFGCAKSLLVGTFEPPGTERGEWTPLQHKSETIGAALRTRRAVSPVFISPGNHMTLDDAVDLTLRCGGKYRIPEPTRRAHNLVNALRRGERSTS